jgi:hypothetical protein
MRSALDIGSTCTIISYSHEGINREKVNLGVREIKYLGHILSWRGIKILSDRILAIQRYPPPKNVRAQRRFIGMVGFYSRFIPDYAHKTAVLHALERKGVKFEWNEDHQKAFEGLKQALIEPPVLQIPDFAKEFVLATDARDVAVSAVASASG